MTIVHVLLHPPKTLCDRYCLSVIPSVCLSVCLSLCEQDYSESNQPASLKLGVIIRSTNRKKRLTVGDRSGPGYGFRITFPLHSVPRHCEIRNFRKFVRISHTTTGRFLQYTWRNDWRQQKHEYPADIRIRIRINPEIRIRIPANFYLRCWPWWRFALSQSSCLCTRNDALDATHVDVIVSCSLGFMIVVRMPRTAAVVWQTDWWQRISQFFVPRDDDKLDSRHS